MKNLFLFAVLIASLFQFTAHAQAPSCSPSVPFFSVDLRGNPTGTWISPGHSRADHCCSATGNERCTSFEIYLDTGAAMVSFEIASGAVPSGSMYYQINCGPQIAVGQPICIAGPGPHYLTFCKPGNNNNTYRVTSIAKPTFPPPDTVRIGCASPVAVLGMVESSVTWNSIFPGAPGAYNSYLSCTFNCDTALYTPASNAPPMVEYLVCGTPVATSCGYIAVCDTVRIYNQQALTGSVTPNPAGFCQGGPGVNLTAAAAGGLTPYTYTWRDQSLNQTCTGTSCLATDAGTYSIEIRDALYDSTYCPATFVSATVIVTPPPVVNAGPDQTLCPTNPVVVLNGSVQYATGGVWSGGNGTFSPSANSPLAGYIPTAAEIATGQVTLTLTSVGAGGGCTDGSDDVTIFFPPQLNLTVADVNAACNSSTGTLNGMISGGTVPYSYQWSTGQTSSSITDGQGTYCLTVTDNLGCTVSDCGTISVPPVLDVVISSTPCSVNGGNDGTATVSVSGGTPPYTYLWSNGATTSAISGLSYGAYVVTATDANGCTIVSSVVVNEPRCNGFVVSANGTNITCADNTDGTATATVVSGTPNYTYLWSDALNQTTATATNLTAGVYQCLVTDAIGCIQTVNVSLTEPAPLGNLMTHVNASAIGGNNGSATANVTGGTPAYTYTWSNGGTTATIGSLTAGTYSVLISDANTCSIADSVRINQPPCANLTAGVASSNVSCHGGNNGSASAIVLFGTGTIRYLWSNGDTTSAVTGLAAGNYSVTVTDSLNCSTFVNFTITEPSPLSIALSATNIRCDYTNDGTIELTVNGGVFPYTYVWSNGLSTEDQINLSNGTYTVTVTDANGCITTGSADVFRPAPLVISTSITPVTCHNGTDAAVNATVSGGLLPYTYSWSSGQTTEDISGLNTGEYLLTVTDANSCITQPYSSLVDQPDTLILTAATAACPVPGSGLSLVNFSATGGNTGAYQYSADGGSNYLAPGTDNTLLPVDSTYTIMVRDTLGCVSPASFSLNIAPEVNILTVSYPSCIADGVTEVPVQLSITGGNGSLLEVSFNNGISWLTAGVYTDTLPAGASYAIIARDSSGCNSVTENIAISTDLVLTGNASIYTGGYNISCQGTATGSVDLSASGGTGVYTYVWSNATSTQDINTVTAGSYSVVVTDNAGCADTVTFTLTEPSALSATVTSVNDFNGYEISCAGGNNGAINFTVTGGVQGYAYSWSNGATTEDVSNLTAGSYSVVVTDTNGCQQSANLVLTAPAVLTASSSQQNILCNGAATGSIDLSATGGVTPYTFSWSNSTATEDLSALTAGTYSILVTDLNGCTFSNFFTLTEPSAVVNTSVLSDFNGYNLSCNGSATGAINLTTTGGVFPYSYNWSNAATTEDLSNVSAGSYSVIISDNNGCTQTQSFTLTEPAALTHTIVAANDYNGYGISCAGSTNGGINLSVNGGVPAYTYLWSNSASNEDLSNLGAGNYSVTVTDLNGCQLNANLALTEPAALNVTSVQQDILCNGLSTASIDLTTAGGVPAYSYAWSNTATSEDVSALTAGTYSVVITDQNSCTTSASFTITEPAALAVSNALSNYNGYNISCSGLADGTVDLTVSGGVQAYSYVWSDASGNEDLSNVIAGTYSVTVTDANGCTTTQSFVLTEPVVLSGSIVSANDFNGYEISCAGDTNGAIDLGVSGGVPAYSFYWSEGSTSEDISNLPAATYSVVVTDANGCTYTSAIVLSEPTALTLGASAQHILCNAESTGSINITPAGGVATYTYAWSNGATTEDLNTLPAGAYSVTITDLNGCTTDSAFVLTEPSAVVMSAVVSDYNSYNVSCYGSTDGSINMTVSGGVPSYSYTWSNGSLTEDLNGIAAGTYTLVITDSNNCTATQSFVLSEPPAISGTIVSVNNYNGYGLRCNGDTTGAINLTVTGGVPSYNYVWSDNSITEDISNLGAGSYSVTVTDQNGCVYTNALALSEPAAIVTNAVITDIPCNGYETGAINLTTTGGVTPFSFLWSTGEQVPDIDSLGAGTYTVTATDANGCTLNSLYIINELAPVIFASTFNAPLCNGDANAGINLSVSGGTAPYTYVWSNGATGEDLLNLPGGTYSVTVTDTNNCTASHTVIIADPAPLYANGSSPFTTAGYNVSNYGANDGSIDVLVQGGTSPYTYTWNNGSTTQDLSGIPAGTYSVQVTDANGCQTGDTITLIQPFELAMPSGFSPNADGYNDYFVVHGIEVFPNNTLEVYNRWGNLVFDASGYVNQWTGTNENGEQLPDGTYFVVLNINNSEIILKGYVDIRR